MVSNLCILGVYPCKLSSSQLLGKEKSAGLAWAFCPPVRKHTLMDTFTKMACHRSGVPERRPRHVEMGCMPVGTAEVVVTHTPIYTYTYPPRTHKHTHTEKHAKQESSEIIEFAPWLCWKPLVVHTVKNLPAMRETQVRSSPEKGMATHSSILAWRIPWTEEPGRLYP